MIEKYDIGLDISTSILGIAVLTKSGQLVELTNAILKNRDGIWEKADEVSRVIKELQLKYKVDKIFIEDIMMVNSSGNSTAHTITLLARFNGIVSCLARNLFALDPTFIKVMSARKAVGIKIDRKDKSTTTKEKVYAQVSKLVTWTWPTHVLKTGPRKGLTVPNDECFDMADAWVIARAGQVMKDSG